MWWSLNWMKRRKGRRQKLRLEWEVKKTKSLDLMFYWKKRSVTNLLIFLCESVDFFMFIVGGGCCLFCGGERERWIEREVELERKSTKSGLLSFCLKLKYSFPYCLIFLQFFSFPLNTSSFPFFLSCLSIIRKNPNSKKPSTNHALPPQHHNQ